ncbi:GatB/YqeY domain-containing protein [Porphyromonas endodontalis]
MNLFDQISEDIKSAMLARDKVTLEALRGIKKEFLEAKTAKGSNGELPDDKALAIIRKLLKQRRDSAEIYTQNGRPELAEAELAESHVLERYLPKQLSEEELMPIVRATAQENGITDPKQGGRLVGILCKQLAGKADGKLIEEVVKKVLASE